MLAITPTPLSYASAAVDRADARGSPQFLAAPFFAFASSDFPRYNRFVLHPRSHPRLFFFPFILAIGVWLSSCAAATGPGYTIEKQEIRVQFLSGSDPRIRVDADYQLRNTGNQPLSSLEMRLPGRRRFRMAESRATWDGTSLAEQEATSKPRNTLFELPRQWKVTERHSLHLSAEFQNPPAGEPGFSFSPDAFFLPSAGWAPELLPARGLFSTGGVPPGQWRLVVRVPQGFLVHTSGRLSKTSRHGGEITVLAAQRPEDRYPFVVAGRYKETRINAGVGKVFLWTRMPADAARFQQSGDSLVRIIHSFNDTFGSGRRDTQPFWLVECPALSGCFTATASFYSNLLSSQPEAVSSELASFDTLMIDSSGDSPKLAAIAPALAASWLGYGQNPGYYEQAPPLSALPAFASALGQESIEGSSSRTETIRRALRMIPKEAAANKKEDASVLRAKSFLFFFALQDRYGADVFHRAINHMLSARRGRGFNLSDLIAAFEEETHQNVAEFERMWMKRPGVPNDFRARYEDASAASATTSKEITP